MLLTTKGKSWPVGQFFKTPKSSVTYRGWVTKNIFEFRPIKTTSTLISKGLFFQLIKVYIWIANPSPPIQIQGSSHVRVKNTYKK